jgi:hypothetical protein
MHTYLGIDVGKKALHVAFLPIYSQNFNPYKKLDPKQWKSNYVIDMTRPDWWRHLLNLVIDDAPAFIAAESTGHHLLAPIAAVLRAYRPNARLWLVDGKTTANTRTDLVSDAKNDRLDAIALCLIAHRCAADEAPRGARPINYELSAATDRLRRMVNSHQRLVKERTRVKNRLNIHAYSMFPAFAGSETWLRAARHGAITPVDIIELAAAIADAPFGDYTDGRVRKPLLRLAADLPNIDADAEIRAVCAELIASMDQAESKIAASEARIAAATLEEPFATVSKRWYAAMPMITPLLVAALHVATYGQVINFTRNEFCAAVGTSPKTSISGDGDSTRSSRKGYRPVRGMLHMYAFGLLSPSAPPNPIRAYHREGKFAATRNKLARILWGVARDERLDEQVAAALLDADGAQSGSWEG